jgi:hypothetical protein
MPLLANKCICCLSDNLLKSQSVLSPFFSYKLFNYKPFKIRKNQFRDLSPGTSYYLSCSVECLNCSMLFLDLRFFDNELKLYYKNYQSKSFFQQRIKFEKSFNLRLKKFNNSGIISSGKTYYISNLEEYIKEIAGEPNIMLDYGSGEGKGTLFKKNKQVKKILYDPFQNKKSNFVISNKEKNVKEKKIQFDLIILRNVLEHVSFPKEVLNIIKKISCKKTFFFIEVPKEKILNNYKRKFMYKKKKIWTEHINIFTKESLLKLIRINNFKLIDFRELKINNGNKGNSDNDREAFILIFKNK